MTDPARVPEWMSKLAEANQRIAELEAERDAAMSLVEASTREGVIAESLKRAEQAEVEVAKLEADRDALKCCFTCDYYDEGFCLWCATPSNGLAAPVHPRCTTCRCTPARWTPREADHATD